MATMSLAPFLAMAGCMLFISVPSLAGSYSETPNYYPEPPKNDNVPDDESPKCQGFHQVCRSSGPYSCCPGFQCLVSPQGVGMGLCIRQLPPSANQGTGLNKKPLKQCRKLGDACVPYGPYECCKDEGIECTTAPRSAGLGVCAPKQAKIVSVGQQKNKCQEVGQTCNTYGPYTCCENKGIRCQARGPAGIGVCV